MPNSSGPEQNAKSAVKISVVLPVFNTEKYLRPLLSSLLSQSESDIEIIAVDDGSTDASLEILREFAERDVRLAVVERNHGGPSAARNTGIARANGRWLAFADSDDWLMPHTLETWCQYAEQGRLDLLIGNGFRFSNDPHESPPSPILNHQPWKEVISGADWIVRGVAVKEWPHYAPFQLVSRKLLMESNARFVEGILHEDILWTLQLALSAQRVGFVRDELYGYRTNPTSIMKDPSPAKIAQRALSYIRLIPHLESVANSRGENRALSRAILRHAFREGASCVALLRRRLSDTKMRGEVSKVFFRAGVHRIMFRGAGNVDEYWRSFRGYFILRKYMVLALISTSLDRFGNR